MKDVVELMPDLVEEYRTNPVGSLVTVRTQPWYFGNTLLIGDAAHAVVPFYGQGCLPTSIAFKSHILHEVITGSVFPY